LFSALGEFLWYLAKTDALSFIRYYIPEYSEYSDDGRTIHGAYGPRLFRDGGLDQVANVISLLRDRPDSRRAVIQLFRATDIPHPYRDVPCTCCLQFLLRGKRLDLVATMRSNDSVLGLPHDVFAFTMLQELIARSVGADVGQYHHMVGSFHLYGKDRHVAWRYLREGWQRTRAMPPMPSGRPWASVERLLAAERAVRKGHQPKIRGLAPYWKDLIRLLEIFRASKRGEPQVVAQLKARMWSQVYRPYIDVRQERAEAGEGQ
jgi:thymidylate synthase